MPRIAALLRRLLLACTAVAMLAGGPAMTLRMTLAAAGPDAHGDAHHPSTPERHDRHTECCDLCAAHCGSVLAATGGGSAVLADPPRLVTAAAPTAAPAVARLRYRLPPALAPPLLLD